MGKRKRRKQNKSNSASWLRPWLKMIGISLVFGGGLFTVALGIERVAASPSFRVERIAWHGLTQLDETEMTHRFKSVMGKNIFRVDIDDMHRRLMAERWIKAATVKKDFPNRLSIFVVERKPAAIGYQLDEQGERLINARIAPVLIDAEGRILEKGGPFPPGMARLIHVNAKAYAKALALWTQLDDYPGSFIDLGNPDDLKVYIADEGEGKQRGLLHLGASGYSESWGRFLAIENQLIDRGPTPWEIDLRFPGQVIVKNGHRNIKPVSGSQPGSIYF